MINSRVSKSGRFLYYSVFFSSKMTTPLLSLLLNENPPTDKQTKQDVPQNNLNCVRTRRISCHPVHSQNNIDPTSRFNLLRHKPTSINLTLSGSQNLGLLRNVSMNHVQASDDAENDDGGNLGLSFSHDRTVANSSPMFSIKAQPISSMTFEEVCTDPHVVLNPARLGFIPSTMWSNDTISFGYLASTFFRRRNSATSKFPHKLYNALKLSECYPDFIKHLGIQWVTNDVFRVDRVAFARLLGVKSIEGGLFHQQGNFPSHGFVELSYQESEKISMEHGLGHADLSQVRFLKSYQGNFTKFSNEEDIAEFKWSAKPIPLDTPTNSAEGNS
ncbi:hypothetical protein TRFO_31668 [Tritrichomonas foetus]|uniref:Initiator binding domain-containing protein n=1 Tax=Tritrichomonas foetus TaxID=1144522 RepID=A0A1J4JVD2_9EUKA|nr:hypothetical protein TRFO_31668 [Tritrichomonas foetus]|eukprot:OHT01484.1 hypothetical protein TRFO_31668 [Tritrichomonas foetus]